MSLAVLLLWRSPGTEATVSSRQYSPEVTRSLRLSLPLVSEIATQGVLAPFYTAQRKTMGTSHLKHAHAMKVQQRLHWILHLHNRPVVEGDFPEPHRTDHFDANCYDRAARGRKMTSKMPKRLPCIGIIARLPVMVLGMEETGKLLG